MKARWIAYGVAIAGLIAVGALGAGVMAYFGGIVVGIGLTLVYFYTEDGMGVPP